MSNALKSFSPFRSSELSQRQPVGAPGHPAAHAEMDAAIITFFRLI